MTVMFERRSSLAAIWARRLAIFSAVLLASATAGHRFAFFDTVPLFWLLGIVAGLAFGSMLLAAIGFLRLWEHGDRGGRAATRAVLIALAVLVPFAIGAYWLFTLPRLTDVSTDVVDPPAFSIAAAGRPVGMNPIGVIPPEAAELQLAHYPSVTGRRYPLAVDRMLDIAATVVRDLGWEIVRMPRMELEVSEATLEAVARSPVFGFVSDVAIRIADEGETSYVDIRSVSRYGIHDLGDNAAKIERFFGGIEAEILARNAPVFQQPR